MSKTKQTFAELLDEIESIDVSMYSCPTKLGANDTPLVTIKDDFIKKIYIYMMVSRRELEESAIALKYEPTNEEIQRHSRRLHIKTELLKMMFWHTAKTEYDLWDQDDLGIREKWQLVDSSNDGPDISELLRLLGR